MLANVKIKKLHYSGYIMRHNCLEKGVISGLPGSRKTKNKDDMAKQYYKVDRNDSIMRITGKKLNEKG